MGIKKNKSFRARSLFIVFLFSALISILNPAITLAAPYTGYSNHPDESKLVDEIDEYQSMTALLQCMNIEDNDPGDNKITYNQAANGEWFGNQTVLVSLVGGSQKTSCNGLVQKAITTTGSGTAIDLFCDFVTVNREGVNCSDPNADQADFYPLDFEVRNSNDQTESAGYRYSDRFFDNVAKNYTLSKPAQYYLYRDALLSNSVCRGSSESSTADGSYLIEDVPFISAEKASGGSGGVPDYITDNLDEEWKTKTVDITVLQVANQSTGFKFYSENAPDGYYNAVTVYPVSPSLTKSGGSIATLGKGYSGFGAGNYNNIVFTASNGALQDAGLYGGATLKYDGPNKEVAYEFYDCAAIAERMKNAFTGADGYRAWLTVKDVAGATGAVNANDVEDDPATSCAVEGVGWIVCPALTFISAVVDGTYNAIDDWLAIDTDLFSSANDSNTFNGWRAMRDIANVGFVIIFMIVIYSQLTGAGISNYGVKKILPRLVIMAIAINASYYVTQFAVDISNILGASLKDFLSGQEIFNTTADQLPSTFADISGKILTGVAVAGIGTAAVAGAVAYGGLGLLGLIALSALIAIGTVFLILAARQALIVILIVISPLAFLAMILPNTKKWFDNWRKIFIALLLIYPMIAIVFGASQMASKILVDTDVLLALAVATVPLFVVIPMLKGSLNAVPIVGNWTQKAAGRLSGGVNSGVKSRGQQARKNFGTAVRKRAVSGEDGNAFRQGVRRFAGGRAKFAQKSQNLSSELSKAEASYVSNAALAEGSKASKSQQAAAVSALHKIEEEEIANIMTLDKHNDMNADAHLARINNPEASVAQRIASVRAVAKEGGQGHKNSMARLSSLPHLGTDERQAIVDASATTMGDKNPAFAGASIGEMGRGEFNAAKSYVRYAGSRDFNPQTFMAMHDASRTEMLGMLSQEVGTSASTEGMRRVLSQINGNAELKAKINPDVLVQLEGSIKASEGRSAPTDLKVDHGPPTPPTAPPPQQPPTPPPSK